MIQKSGVIAVVAPHHFLPPRNGGHWGCYDFCEFSGRMVRLHCICLDANEAPADLSFSVVNVLPSSWRKYVDPVLVFWLYKFIKTNNVKACVVIQPYQAPLAYLACRLARIRFVIYAHNLEFARFRSLGRRLHIIMKMLEKVAYRLSDLVLFVSEHEMAQAVKELKLNPSRCVYLPPVIPESEARSDVLKTNVFRIIFFADFSYPPNFNGLKCVVQNILPLLDSVDGFEYKLEVCGGGLDENFAKTSMESRNNVKYLGFVNDIEARIRQADVLLNPVMEGGGVQIKILKTLAAGTTVISSKSGAVGIPPNVCGEKLIRVDDTDWIGYANNILLIERGRMSKEPTPKTFYEHYYWKNNIPKVVQKILT